MTNELIKGYVGKICVVSLGSLGTTIKGEITNLQDNWIEIKSKKGLQLINTDFVMNIKQIK